MTSTSGPALGPRKSWPSCGKRWAPVTARRASSLACGTGLWAQPIAEAGYRAAGFDISADQLRFARRRHAAVARADLCSLPVRDESVPVVVGMFFHTDLEDFATAIRQVARCLRPGGRFIYAGLHPCFIGPFVNRMSESQERRLEFLPLYGHVGWANRGWATAPGWPAGSASTTRRWPGSSAPSSVPGCISATCGSSPAAA